MQQRYSPAWLMPFSPERWPLMLFNRAAAISYRFVAAGDSYRVGCDGGFQDRMERKV